MRQHMRPMVNQQDSRILMRPMRQPMRPMVFQHKKQIL